MKRIMCALMGFMLALCMSTPAFADHIEGSTGWYVEYTSDGRIEDNYSQASWADNVSKLQPGDDITLTVEIRQSNDTPCDWYLTNAVLKSLEDGDASGSAYGYKLSYEGPSNSRTLYESKSVGGKGSAEGLAEATSAMDDYFYLGTLSKGESGHIKLDVSLDGETEGNAYFDTLARLSLKFAVEPNAEQKATESTVTTTETVVNRTISANHEHLAKTGDPTTLFPVYLGIAGLGIVCLALAIRNVRSKQSEEEGEDA